MKLSLKSRKALTATFGGIVTTLSASVAFAQAPAATPPTPAPATPVVPGPAAPEPGPAVSADVAVTAPAVEPVPEPVVAPEPAPVEPVVEEVPAEEPAAEAPAGTPSLSVFADTWLGIQSAKSGTDVATGTGGDVYATKGPDGSAQSGFGLSWLGADLGYDGGAWAINGSLRFGDAVGQYGTGTLGPVTAANVTWRPVEGLSLIAGTYGTIFGAEVAESWINLNYTRGELYMNMQPFWHTGLKAEYAIPNFVFRALIVNDPNRSNLGEGAVNLAAQVGYTSDMFSLYAGAMQSLAPETSANSGSVFGTFVDVVALLNVGDFHLIGNFDVNTGDEVADFWGASLAAGYTFHPQFGMAIRGEILGTSEGFLNYDPDAGDEDETLMTGTLTFDVKPVKDVDNFIVRLDTRVEKASEVAYVDFDAEDYVDAWYSAVIGIVGKADLL
jgi:Putative beta-barrel porin-2, OmpL-like. bbp2